MKEDIRKRRSNKVRKCLFPNCITTLHSYSLKDDKYCCLHTKIIFQNDIIIQGNKLVRESTCKGKTIYKKLTKQELLLLKEMEGGIDGKISG